MPIYHIFSDYTPSDPDTQIRHMVARKTWGMQHWSERPIRDGDLPRMWSEEGRRFPYLKDIWNLGCAGLNDDDIAIYTNTDICCVSNCAFLCGMRLQELEACYSYRIDFHFQFVKPIPDSEVGKGVPYPGSDLYAFRVRWWKDWSAEFPDLLLGMEGWDPCMRVFMEQTQNGRDVQIRNVIYHQRHGSFWENPNNRYRLNAQRHNINTEVQWLLSLGINPMQFGLRPI